MRFYDVWLSQRTVKSELFIFCVLAFALSALGADSGTAPEPDTRPRAEYKNERIPGSDRSVSHHDFSEEQLDRLRVSIAKLKFPQPGDTVRKLLPVRCYLRGSSMGSAAPNERGLTAVHEDYYSLSLEYVLTLRQCFYVDKTGKSYYLDEAAEVIPRSKLPKRFEPPE